MSPVEYDLGIYDSNDLPAHPMNSMSDEDKWTKQLRDEALDWEAYRVGNEIQSGLGTFGLSKLKGLSLDL